MLTCGIAVLCLIGDIARQSSTGCHDNYFHWARTFIYSIVWRSNSNLWVCKRIKLFVLSLKVSHSVCYRSKRVLVTSKSTYSCILMVLGQYECSDSDWGRENDTSFNFSSTTMLLHAAGEGLLVFALDYCTCAWPSCYRITVWKVYTKWLQSVNTLLYCRVYWSLLTYVAGTVAGMSSVALRGLTSHKRLALFHTQ